MKNERHPKYIKAFLWMLFIEKKRNYFVQRKWGRLVENVTINHIFTIYEIFKGSQAQEFC